MRKFNVSKNLKKLYLKVNDSRIQSISKLLNSWKLSTGRSKKCSTKRKKSKSATPRMDRSNNYELLMRRSLETKNEFVYNVKKISFPLAYIRCDKLEIKENCIRKDEIKKNQRGNGPRLNLKAFKTRKLHEIRTPVKTEKKLENPKLLNRASGCNLRTPTILEGAEGPINAISLNQSVEFSLR